MMKWMKRLGLVVLLSVFAGGFFYALREKPVGVDTATVQRSAMQVSIQEEGVTRVRDVYAVSSPIAGHLNRLNLDEGEAVVAGKTKIASIHPLDPPFLDERTQRELLSAVKAAQSSVALAKVELNRSEMALQLAQSEYDRASKLAKKRILPLSQLEKTFNTLQLQRAQVESAQAAIELRTAELASVKARQQQPRNANAPPHEKDCCIQITAPVDGVVLKILARSEQAVSPGTRIAEIGDPSQLEIVVDLLSSDAARIRPNVEVLLTDWGGSEALHGIVRRVDPAAFTKISSLGIEEQRVNVVIDISKTPNSLGHGYRVLANLVIWRGQDIVQVPIGALFRSGGRWATFIVEEGRVHLRHLKLGHMNDKTAEVLSGLVPDESVILYPNDQLEDGSLVESR